MQLRDTSMHVAWFNVLIYACFIKLQIKVFCFAFILAYIIKLLFLFKYRIDKYAHENY